MAEDKEEIKIIFDTNANEASKDVNKLNDSIVKTEDSTRLSAKGFKELKKTIQDQKDITIEFERELLKLQNLLKETPKNQLQAQKNLKDKIKEVQTALKDQRISLKELNNEQSKHIASTKESAKEIVKSSTATTLLSHATGVSKERINEAIDAFGRFSVVQKLSTAATTLQTFVTNGATLATKALRLALLSTGIGAIIVLIGALVGAYSNMKDATKEAESAQLLLNLALEQSNKLMKQELEGVEFVNKARLLRAKIAGATEAEIAKIEKESNEDRLKAYKEEEARLIELQSRKNKTPEQAEEINKKILENSANYIKELNKQEIDRLETELKIKDKRDADEAKRRAKRLKEQKEEKDRQDTLLKELDDIVQKDIDKAQAISDKAKEANDLIAKTDLERLTEKYEAEKILLEQNGIDTLEIQTKYWNDVNELNLKQEAIEKDKRKKKLEDDKKLNDAILAQAKDLEDSRFNLANKAVGLAGLIAGKNKTLQKGVILADSALGIGRTVVATSASNALATAEGAALAIPTGGASLATAAGIVTNNTISAGLAVASNIAATAKALSALGGGGGGGQAPNISNAPSGIRGINADAQVGFQASNENQIATSISRSQSQQPPIKAFVVGSDVTTQQTLDAKLVKQNSFGG